ncbi:MoaD/ThiS family protein [Acetobacter oeni]|uniref:Molybdopterin synthase sulfur carrier subunit n=1 Tax=Acetobacter oeni TaxID=304077 RepID=A0A511XI37_9PROT|nr:MoaD/ThiS family protein [Acetobacter oeni]MBB3883032.1 molybdopterin synthase sulfur carrier subunit [Acetobacter oeni]NHO19108.1 molybdopterin synthase sulfur carrier subunit [Acetobacter oeni]GBR11599.1 molybdopterin converting factor small subunit MoeD [Acetobacter oeni LMG 21952]GEN62617.1 molybdopterin synthase sulfur carrier subunit [Acetobacter oeni]
MSGAVTVLYFAALREQIGRAGEVMPLDNIRTVSGLLAGKRKNDPVFDKAFPEAGIIRVAVNRVLADFDAPVKAGDEVAFFPPMTGG